MIVTSTGLLFVTAADRKVHVYDSVTGTQLWELPLGGPTSGAPSMYELNGRQYLLVTASPSGGRGGAPAGPTGIVAYALPIGQPAPESEERRTTKGVGPAPF